ncbi:GDP-mannose 4,6-dehydratase [Butyrivibrio fibrisolvens]|uniref:GDP-mannose 4,6-dehydratase n=1 Tax=Butyrivibrio fibrisolvens TaxID=831 RepID=UPI0003B6F08A|nr:GDP-mannose 4,6-dehydratase [Butyrivibrio fibrisolvens]
MQLLEFYRANKDKRYIGNMSSLRTWGYEKDYVNCIWMILQKGKSEYFIIDISVQNSVHEFSQMVSHYASIELEFKGKGVDGKGCGKAIGKVLVGES